MPLFEFLDIGPLDRISAAVAAPSRRSERVARLPKWRRECKRALWSLLTFRLPSQCETDALVRAAYEREFRRLRDPRPGTRFHD